MDDVSSCFDVVVVLVCCSWIMVLPHFFIVLPMLNSNWQSLVVDYCTRHNGSKIPRSEYLP